MKKCPDHDHCYNKCATCGHCDTSYENDKSLECGCKKCACYGSSTLEFATYDYLDGIKSGIDKFLKLSMDREENMLAEGLIALGWTPPPDSRWSQKEGSSDE